MGAILSKFSYLLFLALFFASFVDVQSTGIERESPANFGMADDENDSDRESDSDSDSDSDDEKTRPRA